MHTSNGGVGFRTTQYPLLGVRGRVVKARRRELSGQTPLDETTLTCTLRPLVDSSRVAVRAGNNHREK